MLGDTVKKALEKVGLTESRVAGWVGGPCGCRERQDKLNALDAWARRVVAGKVTKAREYLTRLMFPI